MSESLEVILQELDSVQRSFESELADAVDPESLESLRVKYLGRKGQVAQFFKNIGSLSGPDRPRFGERLNELKESLGAKIDQAGIRLSSGAGISKDNLDLSLPGTIPTIGFHFRHNLSTKR